MGKNLLFTFYYNIPVNTCDTVAQVCGVLQCVKGDYCTHTHKTCDLKPVIFPVPVTIPTCTSDLLSGL
jgi:hypothetical protein